MKCEIQSGSMYIFGSSVLTLGRGSFIIPIGQCVCSLRQLNKGKRHVEKCVPVLFFCVLFSTSVLSRIPQGILDCIYQEERIPD